ncbi:MAG: protein kinase [Verrucomicrobiales bacterium]|nr:protein kinase [Verrucomicrobiae bacterium]
MVDPDSTEPIPRPRTHENLDDAAVRALLEAAAPAFDGNSGTPFFRSWEPPTVEELREALPQYEIRSILARGGMGAVYRGTQRALKREVAIKVLPPGIDDGEVRYASRFKHEAQAMARLSHPNIVAVFEAGETTGGLLYFVMEFIEGIDVARLLAEEGKIEPARALGIVTSVCEALAFAHEEGLIHRDIKPSNIMIDRRGRVKVADFGLAKAINPEATLLTGSNLALGTPDFIAPESLLPGFAVDHRADLFSIGVMLYQMLTGRIPRGRFEPPSRILPGLDKRLDGIVDRTMQSDPAARYSSAIELKRAIEPVLTRSLAKRKTRELPEEAAHSKSIAVAVSLAIIGLLSGVYVILHYAGDHEGYPPAPVVEGSSGSPQRKWEKAWPNAETIPAVASVSDGWALLDPGTAVVNVPKTSLRNGGIRMTGRFDGTLEGMKAFQSTQLQLRWNKEQSYKVALQKDGITFQTKLGNRTLKTVPVILPKPGSTFVLEFIAIDQTLYARLDGQLASVQLSENDDPNLRGELLIYGLNHQWFRDIEFLNLDGLSEAQALEAAGLASSEPVPENYPAPVAWIDATPEVRSRGLRDGKLKAVGDWLEAPAKTDFILANGETFSDMAMRVVFSGSVTLKLRRSRGQHGYFENYAANIAEYSNPQGMAGISYETPDLDTLQLRVQPLEDGRKAFPIAGATDESHEMVFSALGAKLSLWMDGRLLISTTDSRLTEGLLQLVFNAKSGKSPSARIKRIEYGKLEGLGEAEARKLAGMSSSIPDTASTFGGHRYLFVKGQLPWPEAKTRAEQMGGHLATLTSKEEADFVHALCAEALPKKPFQAWLGGTRERGKEAPWKWITDEAFTYQGVWDQDHAETEKLGQPAYLTVERRDGTADDIREWNNLAQTTDPAFLAHIGGYVVEWENQR